MRNFRAAVEDWDEVCSALGAWEAQHLTDCTHDPDRGQHAQWVRELIGWGQMVSRAMEHPGFPDRVLAGRVNARLRHLQDKLALWHGEMTVEEEERILRAAFV